MFNSSTCTSAPSSAMSDAGVAGAGVLLAFVITAGLAILLSTYIVVGDFLQERQATPKIIARRLLNSFSDQQIIEGIGIQAVGLAKMDSMVPYHFFIVWMLAVLSTVTHLATLLALVETYKQDWVLRWLRQFFMFVNLLLNVLYGIFVLEAGLKDLAPTLPMACVWLPHAETTKGGGHSSQALSVAGTVAIIATTCILFILSTWYLHMRQQRWGKFVRFFGLLALMAMAIGAATRVIIASQAFGTPSVKLSGPSESSWSFGQLLGMLMLILPFISAFEIFRGKRSTNLESKTGSADLRAGEIDVARPAIPADDQYPLNGTGSKANDDGFYYQPNPIFGKR